MVLESYSLFSVNDLLPANFWTTLSKTDLRSISQKQKGLKRRAEVVVRQRHTHVGAPENRIKWFPNGTCPDAPGQRHDPGTWTRGRHLTEFQPTTFPNFQQRFRNFFPFRPIPARKIVSNPFKYDGRSKP